MVLHTVAIHDDVVATTGTDLADADFIDGESHVIQREIGNTYYTPVLLDTHYGVYDVAAGAGACASRYKLQPNPWPETSTLGGIADIAYGSKTADAGVTTSLTGPGICGMSVSNKLGIQLTNNLNWVNSGNSVYYATSADEDFTHLLHMSYGPQSKPRGGKILYLYKTFAAVGAADVWDEAYDEVLSDDSPGIDPDRRYRVHAMGATGAGTVATDACLAARISVKGGTCTPAVLGSGGALHCVPTVFEADSIEFNGNVEVMVETIGTDTNDGGAIHLWLEDVGAAVTGGSQGGSGGRIEPTGGGLTGPATGFDLGDILGSFLG